MLLADGPKALGCRDAIFERLAQWSRAVTVDPPGFGLSTPGPDFDFRAGFFGTTSAAHGRPDVQSNVAVKLSDAEEYEPDQAQDQHR